MLDKYVDDLAMSNGFDFEILENVHTNHLRAFWRRTRFEKFSVSIVLQYILKVFLKKKMRRKKNRFSSGQLE